MNVELSLPHSLEPESEPNGICSGGRSLTVMNSQNILVVIDTAVPPCVLLIVQIRTWNNNNAQKARMKLMVNFW